MFRTSNTTTCLTTTIARIFRRPLAAAMLLVALSSVGHAQTHLYEVSYRGVFSLGNDMPIAALSLATEAVADSVQQTRLVASSEPYAVVESLYPIRYRFRSWSRPDNGHLLGFETYEQTRREKHRLYVRDASALGVRRLDLMTGDGDGELQRLEAGIAPALDSAVPLFDRLGLLQHIRHEPLRAGLELRLPVTNGRDSMAYRVRVEGTPLLRLDGQSLPSWKLRLDAFEHDAAGKERPVHRSAFVWLSRDAARIPLRAEVRHEIGLFSVQLTGASPGERLAGLARR